MFVIVELLLAGGMFMFGILATSLVAVGIIAQRVFTLWLGFRLNVESLTAKVLSHVDDGDYGKAAQLCDGKHPLQRMMLAAIERANRGEKEIRRNVETCAITELARFRRGTGALPQISNLATLLGLLGTIHGLIISFSGMQAVDAAARQAALSKGVAVAFYNTFFGLTVATVTIVAYLLVSAKQGREMTRMEAATSALVDRLLIASDSRNAAQRGGTAGAR
jgi:biopolymer transport protein ExbB/TolQ